VIFSNENLFSLPLLGERSSGARVRGDNDDHNSTIASAETPGIISPHPQFARANAASPQGEELIS